MPLNIIFLHKNTILFHNIPIMPDSDKVQPSRRESKLPLYLALQNCPHCTCRLCIPHSDAAWTCYHYLPVDGDKHPTLPSFSLRSHGSLQAPRLCCYLPVLSWRKNTREVVHVARSPMCSRICCWVGSVLNWHSVWRLSHRCRSTLHMLHWRGPHYSDSNEGVDLLNCKTYTSAWHHQVLWSKQILVQGRGWTHLINPFPHRFTKCTLRYSDEKIRLGGIFVNFQSN